MIKIKKIFKIIMPEVAIIIGALIIDLVSKTIVQSVMEIGETVVVIPKLLNFSYTMNKKAAFGFDFGLSNVIGTEGVLIFFIIVTLLAVGFFSFLLFYPPKKGMLYRVSFSLIIGGALGNLFDRIFCAGVRDFIQIEYLGLKIFGSTTFAIFNIADSCVVVGAILLAVYFIFFDKTLRNNKKEVKAVDGEVSNTEDNRLDESMRTDENSFTDQYPRTIQDSEADKSLNNDSGLDADNDSINPKVDFNQRASNDKSIGGDEKK